MSTKISVIIPTYAPKDYLWECLDSLENQTLPKEEFEVIVVLNGDRQPYEDMIAHKMNQYTFYHQLLYSTPKGVSNARNLGMKHAKGSYISFIDDDDWVSENYLENLLANTCPDGIVEANVKVVDEQTMAVSDRHFLNFAYRKYEKNKVSSRFANRSFFSSACCKLIPYDCIGSQQFDPHIKRGEDSIFMYGISWRIKQIHVAEPSCIYYVRRRYNSAGIRKISFGTRLFEFLSQSCKFTIMYMRHITHNDFLFYTTRIAGTFYNKFIQQHLRTFDLK